MGERIRAHDWSTSPLGDPVNWPQSLRAVVALMINSKYPMFLAWGPELAFLYNDGYIPIFGAKHPHTLGLPFKQVWSEIWDDIWPLIDRALRGEATFNEDLHLVMERHGYPEDTWYSFSYSPVRDESGAIAGMFCACTETTQKVLAERDLRESEERLQLTLNAASAVGTWDWDIKEDRVYTDSRFARLFSVDPGWAIEGAPVAEFIAGILPEDREQVGESIQQAIDTKGEYEAEYRLLLPDGRARWVLAYGRAYYDEHGAPARFPGVAVDITERKQDEVLRAAQNRVLELAIEDRPLAGTLDELVRVIEEESGGEVLGSILLLDTEGKRLLHGAAPNLPDAYNEAIHGIEIGPGVGSCGTAAHGGKPVYVSDIETDPLWKDFKHLALEHGLRACWSTPILSVGNEVLGTFAMYYRQPREPNPDDLRLIDYVTRTASLVIERSRAREALREERQRLETLNRTGAALAAELDLESVVQLVTDAGVEMTGANFGAFFYNVLNEEGESYLLYTLSGVDRSAFEGFPMPRNTAVFAPTFEGTSIVRSNDITKDPRYGKNKPRKGMPKGHLPVRSYLAVPVISRSGEVIGGLFFGHRDAGRFTEAHEKLILGVAAQASVAMDNARLYQDVQRANDTLEHRVQERTAELETANEALRQAQKMEAIGQLTGGIAHDFNNMLTVIRGSADILQRGTVDDTKRERYIQAIADTADRAARLTSQLLAFARRQALKPEVFEVSKCVNGIGDMLRTVLGPRIRLIIESTCHDCFVETDAAQFETAIVNMAVNARDAMSGEGDLLVTIGTADRLGSFSGPQADTGYVTVKVTDTGEGIAAGDLDRIFEPFFTTKETGKGTGLGLSQVYGFAKQSGGEIEVDSEPTRGTTFTMYLPRADDAQPREDSTASPAHHPHAEGCILVVEDNPQVGRFAEHALTDLGFETRRASTAAEALALLESGETFDVMFSDIVMPGQSGIDLAREVRKRWPGLPVVLTTGYSDALMVHRDLDFPVLQKPYSLDALSAVLAKALKP